MTHRLIPSTWVNSFYNTPTFEVFEDVISQEQVSVMNLWMIMNSKLEVLNVPKKANIKTNNNLVIPCNIDILSDIQRYVCSYVIEVSTETESDVASEHFKGAQKFHSGQVS